MTANITFPVERRENVMTVPNAALRFRPELSEEEQQKLREEMQARREQRASEREQQPENQARARGQNAQAAGPRRSQASGEGNQPRQGQTVWVLVDGKKIEPRFVRTGLTNGRVTEVVGGNLQEGETVVIGKNETGQSAAPQQTASPFGPQRGFGGGRRR
jgi:HlyD family secretion protein